MSLHDKITQLGCLPDRSWVQEPSYVLGYKNGHRDARHAAAELALQAEATIADLVKALEPFAAGSWTKELAATAYAALARAKEMQ